MLPNKYTKEQVDLGYKDVRTKYIDFVKKYNTSKTAGTITLNSIELDALRKLNGMWKTATVDSKCFHGMEELHDQLNDAFPETSEDVVSTAWRDYENVFCKWLAERIMSSATMFSVEVWRKMFFAPPV